MTTTEDTSTKDDLNGRQSQWKTISMEDNLNGRQTQWKQPQRKMNLIEDDLNER